MKTLFKHIIFTALFVFFAKSTLQAQSACDLENDYTTVCIGNPQTYPAATSGSGRAHTINPGNNYGCLSSTPNPAWFYFKVDTSGSLKINQTNSTNADVDGALWGPFDSLNDIQTNCNSFSAPMACDYLANSYFSFNVNVTAGKFYVLLVTNYSGSATNITLADGGSTATTNCNPDIQIEKTVDKSNADELESFTWTISAENKGITDATNLVITDILPTEVSYVSHTGGTYNTSNGQWNIGTLAPNQTATLTITSTANSGTGGCTITNTVSNVSLNETEIGAAIDDLSESIFINDTTDPVSPTLVTLTDECTITAPIPTTTDMFCGTSVIVTGTTSDPTTYNTQGTHIITWNFDDGNGNDINVNQTIIIDDNTAPTTPTLATLTGECSATAIAPTTTDACVGTITGTTSDPLTYSDQGTYTISWNFNDGNGNSTTANQTIIIDDITDPITPSIATITGECSATATAPTTTDNCSGSITGTTSDPLTYSTQGTHIITWNFDDGNDNSISVNQSIIVTSAPTITSHPQEQNITAGSNATFSVGASYADTYQWQVSTDGGVSYNDIATGVDYSGTQTSTLTAISVQIDKKGYVFRAIISKAGNALCSPATSDGAILLITTRHIITNRRITYRVNRD